MSKSDLSLTDRFLAVWVVAALAFEVFVISRQEETISACYWRRAREYPLVPFLSGLLCGHLAWQQYIAAVAAQSD